MVLAGSMTDLRKLAEGKPCQIRLPGCDGGETTVLAHYRLAGLCGWGMKPPDICGAWACMNCHQLVDGSSRPGMSKEYLRLAHAEGVIRTLAALDELDVL